MEIKNEDHAREMILEWQKIPRVARKRELKIAIEQLELSSMYYDQKGNDKGCARCEKCILILKEHLASVEDIITADKT